MKSMMRGALKEALQNLKGQMRKRRGKAYDKGEEEESSEDQDPDDIGIDGNADGDAKLSEKNMGEGSLSKKVKSAETSANDEIVAKTEGRGDMLQNEMKGFMKGIVKRKPMKTLRVVAKDMNQGKNNKKGGRPRKDA